MPGTETTARHRLSPVCDGEGVGARAPRPRLTSDARRPGLSPGFTMVEMIVVLVILALLTTLAVPRLTRTAEREFGVTLEAVSDLLTMYAQREMLEQKPVGILYDPGQRALLLVGLDPDPRPGEPSEWLVDRYVQPVKLPWHTELIGVVADGQYVDVVEWPLTSVSHSQRPSIAITLQSEDNMGTVTLASHAIVPERSGYGQPAGRSRPAAVDLDGSGRIREEW